MSDRIRIDSTQTKLRARALSGIREDLCAASNCNEKIRASLASSNGQAVEAAVSCLAEISTLMNQSTVVLGDVSAWLEHAANKFTNDDRILSESIEQMGSVQRSK